MNRTQNITQNIYSGVPQRSTADKFDNATGRNKSKDIGGKRYTQKLPEAIQTKQDIKK